MVQPEVPVPGVPGGARNEELLRGIEAHDVTLVAGEASSHCVFENLADLLEEFGERPETLKRIHVLRDCMSPVQHPDIDFRSMTEQRFREFEARGLRFMKSTDPLPGRGGG